MAAPTLRLKGSYNRVLEGVSALVFQNISSFLGLRVAFSGLWRDFRAKALNPIP